MSFNCSLEGLHSLASLWPLMSWAFASMYRSMAKSRCGITVDPAHVCWAPLTHSVPHVLPWTRAALRLAAF